MGNYKLLAILTCCMSLFVLLVRAGEQTGESKVPPAASTTSGAPANQKLQARISLESKADDIDEKSPNGVQIAATNHEEARRTTPAGSGASSNQRGSVPRKRKASRRLSNIWSMFLPSSSADSDYEDSVEASDGAESSSGGEQVAAAANSTSGAAPIGPIDHRDGEKHDERLVAKYLRPPTRQDGSAGSEPMLASSSGSRATGVQQQQQQSEGSQTTTGDLQPVQLITGALNRVEPTGGQPNMNDIVSGLMGALGNGSSGAPNSSLSSAASSSEREDDEDGDERTRGARNNATSAENSNFERWLNRIKFQETSPAPVPAPPTTTTTTQPPTSAAPPVIRRPEASPRPSSWPADQFAADRSAAVKWPTKGHPAGIKTQPKRTLQSAPIQPYQPEDGPQQGPFGAYQSQFRSNLHQSHPFQRQLRQKQAQLIHGIKFPTAQASSISVSTQDQGASNTSLAFGSHYIPQLTSSIAETSQAVNATPAPLSSDSSSPVNLEQSAYQSQDEILKQVTSAINFEQQLIQQKRSNELASGLDAHHQPNQPREGHQSPSKKASGGEMGPVQGGGRLFKVGSSLEELAQQGPAVVPADRATGVGSGQAGLIGPEDIDKSFDLLAEKVRQLAGQQQLLQNGSQPSWLRPPQSDLASNLTQLVAGLGNEQLLRQRGQQLSLEQIRDLLNKHERTRNELKSSQESMAQLVRQLMQMRSNSSQSSGERAQLQAPDPLGGPTAAANLIGNAEPATGGEQGQRVLAASNFGWTPLDRPAAVQQQHLVGGAPISPANMVKQRLQHHPAAMRPPSQLADSAVGVGADPAGADYFNQLMLAHQDEQSQQRLIGLPIAILEDDSSRPLELSPGQIEEAARLAAEQLAGPTARRPDKPPHLRPADEFVARLAPSQVAQSRLQNASPGQLGQVHKLLQTSSPQAFVGQTAGPGGELINRAPPVGSQQANLMRLEKLASLLPPNEPSGGHSEQQQQVSSGLHVAGSNPVDRPAGDRDGATPNALTGDEFRIHMQSQQRQQPLEQPQPAVVQQQVFRHHYGQVPRPAGFLHDLGPLIQGLPRGPLVATTSLAGPPMKLREVSLYRPFGFRSHHAISYQASPALAAAFPQFLPTTATTSGRPSILRHMTPVRAALSEGRGLLGPLVSQQLLDHLDRQQYQYPTHNSMGTTLPIPPMRQRAFLAGSGPLHHPLKRRQSSKQPEEGRPIDSWPMEVQDKFGNSLAQSRMRMRHMEPADDELSHQLIEDPDLLHGTHIEEEIKYIPLNEDDRHLLIEEVERHLLPPLRSQHQVKRPLLTPAKGLRNIQRLSRHQGDRYPTLMEQSRIDQPVAMRPQPCPSSTTTTPTTSAATLTSTSSTAQKPPTGSPEAPQSQSVATPATNNRTEGESTSRSV